MVKLSKRNHRSQPLLTIVKLQGIVKVKEHHFLVQPLFLKLPFVKQASKPSHIRCLREQGEASFVCLWVIDRSQTRLLESLVEIYKAVELPVSAVALTKPLPIVFEN